MQCLKCGESAPDNTKFCEVCGEALVAETDASLAVTQPLVTGAARPSIVCRCGAGPEALDPQGYCSECGRLCRIPQPRDRVEVALALNLAGVSDRGLRHSRNEDDLALAVAQRDGRPVYILVVSDGVSNSENANAASRAAVESARDALLQALAGGDEQDGKGLMQNAISKAHHAVCGIHCGADETKDPPSATIVAAVVRDHEAVVAWVGDSRAYSVNGSGAELLTHDHSWINEAVDSGLMTEAEARQSRNAHAITRCLGPLSCAAPGQAPEASVVTRTLPEGARLLLCSDGLWNYAEAPWDLAALLGQPPDAGDALAQAQRLVQYAISKGGRDNVTAAVLAL